MLDEHLGYVADAARLGLYRAAVARTVKPGDCVADLGCGSGVLGLLCLQAGAGRVYAIDASAMLEVARESLVRAGWGGQASFIQGQAHHVDLPEQVDVVICDQVGYFGFDYGILHSLADARKRFLKPGGALIPARIELQIAAVESQACHNLAENWAAAEIPAEFHWLRQHAVNTKQGAMLRGGDLLSPPAWLGSLDLCQDNPDFLSWEAELRIGRGGILHGLGGWFECELAQGVWMTNSPLADRPIHRPQAFLPLGEAVEVKAGERLKAKLMARPADSIIAWDVEISSAGRKFSHSTWLGEPLAPAQIARQDPARRPRPSREGRARMIVLGLCDGQRTARQIEEAVLREHPGLFPTATETARFVARVLGRDTE